MADSRCAQVAEEGEAEGSIQETRRREEKMGGTTEELGPFMLERGGPRYNRSILAETYKQREGYV